MKDKSLDDTARQQQIGALLAEVLDTRKMALFMLGDVREKPPPQISTFIPKHTKRSSPPTTSPNWTLMAGRR
jgi:hypothetical protein